jgi:hypothetical protein
MPGRGEWWALDGILGGEAPKPILAGLEALDDRMTRARRVFARVLGWRGITAADVAASGAPAKVKPPSAGVRALNASSSAWRD